MKKSVLFVCLGNICRSPTAEAIFTSIVKKARLDSEISCDSAGTSAHHVGEPADSRMQKHAIKRGYDLTSMARQFDPSKDLESFDYVITMDNSNYRNVSAYDTQNVFSEKIHKMTKFCVDHLVSEVPDPYWGGDQGFEEVIDILEDGCQQLFLQIEEEIK